MYVCVSAFSNISSETVEPNEAKFHVESPWDGWGMKVCSNGPGHMTNMAAMPIYGKNLKNKSPMTVKLGMQHQVLENYQVCSNDDPWLALTFFTGRSNLLPYAFVTLDSLET